MTHPTPGPWLCERHGIVTAEVGGVRRQVASTTGDAVMHGDPSQSVVDIQMANAHLLSAAPDLLAALSSILELYPHQICVCGRGKPRIPDALADAGRAAIRKARGES